MKKIKVFLLTVLLAISGTLLHAQTNDMVQMIPVRVIMPVNKDVKGDALTVLYNRLNQAVTLNGLGSSTNESRFLIVTSITVLSKNVTTTIPPQHIAEVEMAFYFVDNVNKVILAQEIITKKGMDNTDDKAITRAINSVKARDPKLKKLINVGKKNAIEYYKAIGETESSESDNTEPDVLWIFIDN